MSRVARKPPRQRKILARNNADGIQVVSRVTRKPSRLTILTTENGSLWLSREQDHREGKENGIAIKRTKETGIRNKESNGQV